MRTPLGLLILAAACGPLLVACGDEEAGDRTLISADQTASTTASTDPWPVPESGNEAARAVARMPEALGAWDGSARARGTVSYRNPSGAVTLEAADLADQFGDPDITVADAVERLAGQMDARTPCMAAPYHCSIGRLSGQETMLFGRKGSTVLVVATWPDDEARDLLRDAWETAQEPEPS